MAAPLQTLTDTRQSTLPPPAEHFSTPAPGAAQPPSNLFITPKVRILIFIYLISGVLNIAQYSDFLEKFVTFVIC